MDTEKPLLYVTVFSDYICPFCYIGSRRLLKLRDEYRLRIQWRSIEIHPETPAGGMPIRNLGYDPQRWEQMMRALHEMAVEDGIPLREHDFTTNSRMALLLAEAAREQGRERFYDLHERLFAAFHTEGLNIGEPSVLSELAQASGLDKALAERAWTEEKYPRRLQENLEAAAAIRLSGTPTYIFGTHIIPGAVPEETLRTMARETAGGEPPPI